MASASSFTKTGTKSTAKVTLDKTVFDLKVENHNLLKLAYQAYLNNGRANLAKVKTRGEVRGSTKKPWKQKGTGRARFGSKYNPIWRGGGITFGPTGEENYKTNVNVKAKRTAIKQALSLAASENRIIVIDDFTVSDGKTKSAQKLVDKIGANGRVLILSIKPEDQTKRSTRNLKNIKLVEAKYLNVYDLMNAEKVVIVKSALSELSDWLNSKPTKETAL